MFDVKLEGVEKALRQSNSKIVIRATRNAVNDVADGGKAEVKRQLVAEYGIQPSKVSKYLKVVGAKQNEISATIIGLGKGLLLSYFKPKQEGVIANKKRFKYKGKGRTRGGAVTVDIKGRKQIGAKYGNMPFVARMKSGHVGVFVRRTKKRTPIESMFGPGVGWRLRQHEGHADHSKINQREISESFQLLVGSIPARGSMNTGSFPEQKLVTNAKDAGIH